MPEASHETNGQATTVLLANGHRLFGLGLKEILSADGSIEVLGEAENDEEAVALTEETKPDVVVLDADDEPVTGAREVVHNTGILRATEGGARRPYVTPFPLSPIR